MTAIILQVAGTLALVAAGWLLHPAAGLTVAGVALVAFGLAVERNG